MSEFRRLLEVSCRILGFTGAGVSTDSGIPDYRSSGGVAWDYLQYPLGLHGLGLDVYYVEDTGLWRRLRTTQVRPPWFVSGCGSFQAAAADCCNAWIKRSARVVTPARYGPIHDSI